jgi:hypothetical protein
LASGFVAALISWRLLIGSRHDGRKEKHASESLQGSTIGSMDVAAMPSLKYRAKTIRICNNPCPAAVKLRNKSFHMDAVPKLPLPECDRTCFCDYANHDDRRVNDDRRYPSADIVSVNDRVSFVDRRKQRDRRYRVKPYQGIY